MRKLKPITPGELLMKEFLRPLGISQYRLAKEIGVPAQRIGQIVKRKRIITADTDLRLCRFFGLSNGYWLRPGCARYGGCRTGVGVKNTQDQTVGCMKPSMRTSERTSTSPEKAFWKLYRPFGPQGRIRTHRRATKGPVLVLGNYCVKNSRINKNVRLLDGVAYELDMATGNVCLSLESAEHVDEMGFDKAAFKAMQNYAGEDTGEDQGFDRFHQNCVSYVGSNQWFDQRNIRFYPDNIIFEGRRHEFIRGQTGIF